MKPRDIKILVVDDEPELVQIIKVLFEKFNFSITTSNSGNHAWQLLQGHDFDLVLTDVRMTDGDGIELAKKIRARHPRKPSVLFMTGFSDLLNEEIYHLGAEGKFTKPFDNNAVRTAIETCMMLPSLRWKTPLPVDNRRIKIELKGDSVESLSQKGILVFGRGGFFAAYNKFLPEKGTLISFEINIENPIPFSLNGQGIIRWTHSRSKSGIPAGLGIEITYLPEAESNQYHDLFQANPSYIPSPFR